VTTPQQQFDFLTHEWQQTWTYDPKDGGYLIPDVVVAEVSGVTWPSNIYWRERSWEDRLREAIEQKSIRFRLRVFWFGWSYRLRLAWDVLRGRHECDY
jgi:hypothetical protein